MGMDVMKKRTTFTQEKHGGLYKLTGFHEGIMGISCNQFLGLRWFI